MLKKKAGTEFLPGTLHANNNNNINKDRAKGKGNRIDDDDDEASVDVEPTAPPLCSLDEIPSGRVYSCSPANVDSCDDSWSCSGASDYVRVPTPTAPAHQEEQSSTQEEEEYKCPICLDRIDPEEGVMRCSRNHYFHRGCLQEWIRHARSQGGATCPLCRGPLQVHADRLRAFLDGEISAHSDA